MLPSGDVQEFGPRGTIIRPACGSIESCPYERSYGRWWDLSPDGTQLAWAISTDTLAVSNSLLIMPVTGGAIRELTRLPRPSEVGDPESEILAIRWAPDSQRLLYQVGRRGDADREHELWQVPAEGGAPARLDLPLDLGRSRLHPDGRSVMFWTQELRNEIWLMEGFSWQDSGR